ncbi:serine/threonine-protein kinase [Trujillonella endophytica]|uniref:non-specific serine/threonine protein kinase n=1 Tax=Trujillonella endophytica TaxID=673521 RepID=A0A1H8S0T0_9ACTN|nr:serine/threonine-protein kinase [Trujillella endophytica]SEO72202.1 serine/threonine protein kinase [Trujillella endophytica]
MTPEQEATQFGPYRVLGVLGRGGMGQVLRAHDAEHQRDVALKLLPAQWATDEHYRERFRREAQIAARLNEPHVVPIHRYGEIDGQLFLDMRLVEGEDLGSLLARSGPLDPARATDLVGQVGRALDAAHAGGLVHRDVKPSNVLLVGRADGADLAGSAAGEDFAYLADFGIARVADEGTGPGLTGTGLAIGSTEYMAPERFSRESLDGRADVYSLACVFFELLTGRRPFAPGDPMGLMYAHLHEEPPAPSSLRPGLPAALDAVVLRGLAKDRERRWPTAGAMAAAARAALAGSGVPVPRPDGDRTAVTPLPGDDDRPATRQQPVAGAPPTVVGAVVPGAPAPRRRNPLPWVVVALLTAAALALAVLAVVLDRRADTVEDDVEATADRLLTQALPGDLTAGDCTVQQPGEGELRRLLCPDGDADSDVPEGTYRVHADDGAERALQAEVEENGLRRLEDTFDCGSGDTPQGWLRLTESGGDAEVGSLACYVDEEGDAVLTWTWDDLGSSGIVELRGGGESGLSTLRSWWGSNADRGF